MVDGIGGWGFHQIWVDDVRDERGKHGSFADFICRWYLRKKDRVRELCLKAAETEKKLQRSVYVRAMRTLLKWNFHTLCSHGGIVE